MFCGASTLLSTAGMSLSQIRIASAGLARMSCSRAARYRYKLSTPLSGYSASFRNRKTGPPLKYKAMLRDLNHKKRYSASDSLDVLPPDDKSFVLECARLESAGECSQLLHLLLLWSKSTGLPVRLEHSRALLSACLKARDASTADTYIMGDGSHVNNPALLRQALHVFSASGAVDRARNILTILTQLGEPVTSHDFNMLLNAVATTGNMAMLGSVTDEMSRRGVPLSRSYYNLALKACVQSRNHDRALAVFEEMQAAALRPDKYAWSSMIQSHIAAGDLPGAEKMLEVMMVRHSIALSAQAFNLIMKAHADAGNATAVYKWLDMLISSSSRYKYFAPSEFSFSICLSVASKAGDKPRIRSLMRTMHEVGVEMNHTTWRMATAPFGKTLDAEGLRSVIDMLVSLGVQTSFVVWRDLLGVLSRLGRADEAYAVLREMQPKYGVKPDQSCYVRVVRAYCQSPAPTMTSASEGEKTGGAEMEAASGSPQRHDFTSLLANYSSYDDLPSLGLSMDDQRDARLSRSSSGLSMYQLGSGSAFNWRAGLDVVRDMRLQGVAPTANVWKYVYLSCAASTQVALGESVVGNMINLLSEMYQSDRILPQSLDWGHLVSLLNFDETSLEEVFEDYGGDGDIYANRGLHPFIGRSNRPIDREEALLIKLLLTFTPNALAQFLEQAVQVLCRQGQQGPDKAFHLLCKLKPHREAHLPAWNVLLTVYSSVGQTEKCHTVLKSFEHLTSTHAPISLWLRLVDSFAFRENAFEKSFAVADGLILKHDSKFGNYNSIDPDRQYLVPFFNRLLEIAVMANNPSRFAHYFQQISDMSLSPDLDTYRILAAQYTRSQRISLFDDCITEMIKLIVSGGGGDLETAELPHQRNTNYVDKIGTIVTDGIPNNSTSRNIAVAAAGLPKIEDILVKERNRRTRLVEIQFTPLLVVLVENEYWGTAERLILRLREELSVSCEILCGRYMVNLASRGKIEDAVAYAERCILGMSIEFLRDLSVWHALLQHAREYKQPQEAQFTMEKMLFTLNIQPDVLCWNILIHTYGDAGRLSDVENTIKDMQRFCHNPPPESCWSVLFEAYKQQRDPEGCLALIRSMYRSPGGLSNENSRSSQSPRRGFFSISKIWEDYICREEFNDSRSTEFVNDLAVVPPLQSVKPTLTHWYHVLHAYSLYKGGRAAYKQLCVMREEYNLTASLECYTCVLKALIQQDEPELIAEVLRCMNSDAVAIPEGIRQEMESMRRFDIVLEAMDDMGGLNGTKR